jgi:hypothetical protein
MGFSGAQKRQMASGVAVMMLGVGILLGCPPQQQQPPPAQYQIEIFAGKGLVFQANPSSPPYDWVWGGAALAPVPGIGIQANGGVGSLGAPITVDFLQATDLDPNNLSQLAVFLRDPNEQRQTFDLTFDPTVWRQEVDLCHLPQVPILTALPGMSTTIQALDQIPLRRAGSSSTCLCKPTSLHHFLTHFCMPSIVTICC